MPRGSAVTPPVCQERILNKLVGLDLRFEKCFHLGRFKPHAVTICYGIPNDLGLPGWIFNAGTAIPLVQCYSLRDLQSLC